MNKLPLRNRFDTPIDELVTNNNYETESAAALKRLQALLGIEAKRADIKELILTGLDGFIVEKFDMSVLQSEIDEGDDAGLGRGQTIGLRLTDTAISDIRKTSKYAVSLRGGEYARAYLKSLNEDFISLSNDQRSAVQRRGFDAPVRIYSPGEYFIVYLIDDDEGLLIVRVLHELMLSAGEFI